MPEQETRTSIKPKHVYWESFCVGFASTCGMMAAFYVVQNRAKVKAAVKALLA